MAECNVENRTIFCDDNIDVLEGINSECIDLIYLDPPFNKNKRFIAPIGTSAEGASFKDIFNEKDLKEEWLITIQEIRPDLFHFLSGIKGVGRPYNFAYLAYMAIRLIECNRVLKSTGSIYLHCDSTMSHYLKITMDCIFGEDKFRNEIIWKRNPSHADSKVFGNVSETILFYGSNINKDSVRVPIDEESKIKAEGVPQTKRFLHSHPGIAPTNIWLDIKKVRGKQYVGYPTQKPIDLLKRIVKASSNEGDIVLDPFCGCATTCVAAEDLKRKWIGIDISVMAYELVKLRLSKEVADPTIVYQYQNVIHMKTDPPKRTDQGVDYSEQKFVYVVSHPSYPGEYKVGIAKNWKSRLNSFQTSDPDRQYRMEFKLETPWFRATEKYVHEKFENKHEWVKGNLNDIIREIKNYKPADQSSH